MASFPGLFPIKSSWIIEDKSLFLRKRNFQSKLSRWRRFACKEVGPGQSLLWDISEAPQLRIKNMEHPAPHWPWCRSRVLCKLPRVYILVAGSICFMGFYFCWLSLIKSISLPVWIFFTTCWTLYLNITYELIWGLRQCTFLQGGPPFSWGYRGYADGGLPGSDVLWAVLFQCPLHGVALRKRSALWTQSPVWLWITEEL